MQTMKRNEKQQSLNSIEDWEKLVRILIIKIENAVRTLLLNK